MSLINMINITAQPGLIDVFDADTQELLFVMGSEDMKKRAEHVDSEHRNKNTAIRVNDTGWSEHRAIVARQARLLLFVGKPMPEAVAKSHARDLDKFSKSKRLDLKLAS